jgi:hypothetical protein
MALRPDRNSYYRLAYEDNDGFLPSDEESALGGLDTTTGLGSLTSTTLTDDSLPTLNPFTGGGLDAISTTQVTDASDGGLNVLTPSNPADQSTQVTDASDATVSGLNVLTPSNPVVISPTNNERTTLNTISDVDDSGVDNVQVTQLTPEQIAINAGFPSIGAYTMFNGDVDAYNSAKSLGETALQMAVRRTDADLRYDVNNDGKITSLDALMLSKGTPLRTDIEASGSAVSQVDPVTQAVTSWLTANPNASDLDIANYMDSQGLKPADIARITGTSLADVTNRYNAAKQTSTTQTEQAAPNTTKWRDFTLDNAVVDKLAGQIKAQQAAGTAQYYQGEGLGSIEANTAEMARILASTGVTDISQFGRFTKTGLMEEVSPDGKGGYTDSKGNAVDPSLVTQSVMSGEGGDIVSYTAPVGTQEVFGNTLTKKEVPNTYSERQTGDAFGGTFAGSGNTGYRVQFSQDGTPIFYTTGASSNTLVNMFADNPLLGKVATAAAAYFGGPAGVAALQAAMGKSITDIAQSALLTYVGGQVAGQISGSVDLVSSIGADATNILAKGVGKFISSEGKANIVDSLVGGAIDTGVGQITDQIPEFKDLTQGQQDFTKNVIRTAIQNGGNLEIGDLVDAAITAGTAAASASKSGNIDTAIQANNTISNAVNAEAGTQTGLTAGNEDSVNDNAQNTINQLEAEALATNTANTTANNLAGGEFAGVDAAVAANAAANNTVIGNAEADNIEEAAYLARQRNPTGTSFTFGGQTYTMGASNAAVNQASAEARAEELKNNIANAPSRSEAYRIARQNLGANATFTWGGKEYSTATAEERPDLTGQTIESLNKANLATVTDASKTVAAQSDTAARETAAEELTKQQSAQKTAIASMEKTGLFGTIANAIQGQMKLSSEAANDYLKNNPNSPITNSVSTAYEAAGNLQKNVAGGIALLTDNKPLADAFVKSGNDLTSVGQSIGNGVVDSKNWNDTTSLIQNAQGWEKLGILAGRIMDGTSGLGRQVEVELRQELPGLFLGGGSVKGIMVATGLMDVGETVGDSAINTYDSAVKQGKTHADALADARIAGAAAGLTEAAIQLTLGKIGEAVIGKVGSVGAKATGKVVGEGLVEGAQEGGSSLAVNAVLGQDLDVNKALTQTVLGGAVGKGTAVTTSPADIATNETINNSISTAISTGDAAGVNTAITNSVQQSLSSGSSVEIAVGSSVSSAITNGADAESSITAAVSSAVTSGADVNQTVTSSIDSAITAGADTTTAINSTVTSAISSGADSTQVVGSAVTSAVTAGADVSTSVTSAVQAAVTAGADVSTASNAAVTSAVTASVASGADVSTAISSSVEAAVSAGADVATATTTATTAAVTASITAGTDTSTAVSTAVDAAVTAGADVTTATNSAVTAAVTASVTSGTDTATAINSSVNAAVDSGANINTAVTTAVTAAVDSSITQAVTNGTDVSTAITSSVASSVSSAVTNQTSITTAVETAVSTAISSAATNNTDVTAAVSTAVTSAITTAVTNNVEASTTITSAVDSAVTSAINNNVDANTAITTSVNSAITASVTTGTNVDTNTNANVAVNAAVTAAVIAGVDTNTAVNAAVTAAVNANVDPNININIDEITKTANTSAQTATEQVTSSSSTASGTASGTASSTPDKTAPSTKTPSKKTSEMAGALAGGFTFSGEGKIDSIKESLLKTYMTKDKFQNPLEKLHLVQETEKSVMQNMIDQGIDPHLASVLSSRLGTDMQTDPESTEQSNLWRFGQEPDNIEDMLTQKTEAEAAFKEGGYVAPLQMASGGISGGSMALPLLAKSGGALGALPRSDGRLDFRHGAHVAGEGDGQSDDIKAMLADGEFVFPADVVSALGNGSTKAGSDKLYEMMHAIRDRARSAGRKDLPPPALKSPLDYLKKGSKK